MKRLFDTLASAFRPGAAKTRSEKGALTAAQMARAAFPPGTAGVDEGAGPLAAALGRRYNPADAIAVRMQGAVVHIPDRIYMPGVGPARAFPAGEAGLVARCLCTRSTDGFVRHAAVRGLLDAGQPWVVPFVVLLAGDYVVQIIDDLVAAMPRMDATAYGAFARENPQLMNLLHARAVSYWNAYYRYNYPEYLHRRPDWRTYPGCVFLHQLEVWAK